ncbi:hypothetical protein Pcinc_026053 [Petrolisthes cinctipes]|uniref:Transmembrane protein 214 n=1 Tax=Petrolisthes cinctipes TaxID=88211 RepID=A0AAE1F7N3_PETCI|nr:hypothetical protein Pcinc_036098 [Petrolisthes cinctipes]KAK3868576.1 hypothetical protein Pcinc_026053 [Petrolisthes cinctipes]
MADTGEWELVGKPSKKNKNASVTNGKLSKEEKKQFLNKAPRIIPTVSTSPVKYFPGCIDVEVIGKENRLPNSPKAVSEPPKKKPEKKKKKDNALHQPGTLEEAVRRLSVAQMQNLLDVVVSRFHDSPLIWLKDLASYLNVRVNPIHSPDPAFRGHPLDYPVSFMNEEVKKLVLSTVSGCSDGVLAAFHKHCVQAMVQEQVKGLGVVGYKIFIQILAMHRPEVGVVNLPFYCELRQDLQSQTPACLSLLWAVGQSGVGNFTIGLRVWLELMMPVIGLKNYSSLVVEYGSMVFGGGAGESGNVLGVRQFYSIFDFTWTTSASLPKSVQRQLFALYPKVKTTAFSSSPENTLRNFFPSFLRRLDPYTPHPLRVELLTCLVQCLTQDTQCWSIWSQLYLKHLPQSAILLHHLGEEWNVLGQSLRVQVREAREAVAGFARSNKQLAVKSRAVTGVREATEATQVLLSQMKVVQEKSKAKTPRIMKLLGLLLVAAIIWDIKSAGSFYGSRVGQTVERLGVVPYLEAFGRASRKAFIQSYRWCVMNVPIMYSRSCELAGPYLQLVVEKTSVVWGYCWGLLETAAAYIPVAKQKFETSLPGVSAALTHYGSVGWQLLQDGYANIREASAPYLLQAHQFLITKVFVGPLAPEKLQEHLVWAIDYVSQHLGRLHSGLVNALNDTTLSPKAV